MAAEVGGTISLDALPEGCIANTLSLTSPVDTCLLSLISSTFRSAAKSDAVWERFLPHDYRDIISRSDDAAGLLAFSSKKDLYFRLCDFPVLIDGSTMSFSLEKKSGKKWYMMGARSLKIVWGDTPRYWTWVSLPQSRFPEVAELLDVCWFEISGSISLTCLSPNTKYAAYFVFALQPNAYGLDYHPINASVEIVNHEEAKKKQVVFLNTQAMVVEARGHRFLHWGGQERSDVDLENDDVRFSKKRSDAWMEVELGEFFVQDEGEVVMRLEELRGHWKSGLIVEGIEIRPKEEEDT